MGALSRNDLRLALTCALIGSVLGFIVGKEWDSVPDLRDEVARLEAELNQKRLSQTNAFKTFTRSGTAVRPVRQAAENTQPELSQEQQLEKLKSEISQRLDAALARAAAENAAQYGPVLSELGLPPEAILQVRSNLVELHKKANTAGEPMGQLALARAEYDKNMRSLLGEDAYKRYRMFEESKPALREYEMLRQFALEKRGRSLDPAEAPVFVDLIREAGATTTVTWNGPYDPLPRPIAGTFLIESLEPEYNALVDKANALLAAAVASGISESTFSCLKNTMRTRLRRLTTKWFIGVCHPKRGRR